MQDDAEQQRIASDRVKGMQAFRLVLDFVMGHPTAETKVSVPGSAARANPFLPDRQIG